MATTAEIDALYESTLKPRLESLEGLRKSLRGILLKAGLLMVVPIVLFALSDVVALAMPEGLEWLSVAVPFAAIFVAVVVAAKMFLLPGIAAYANYRSRFKHEVAAEVFRIVCPAATYSPFDGIAEEIFDAPGMFNTRGGFSSDDRVRGTIGQTTFEAADVSRSYSTGGKNSRTVVVFRGLFFHLDFNKTLRGVTLVDPKSGGNASRGDRLDLTEVSLENPAFDEKFTVHASDEIEARYILTPAMMERILALQVRTERPIYVGFKNNRAYLGINYGRALFEPGIRESTSAAALHEMAAHFALADGIVHELDLNTRIWTKGVDDSLLHVEDEPVDDEGLEAVLNTAAREGTLTAESIWQAALKSTSAGADEAADAAAPPPASTSIVIDRSGQNVVVSYPIGVGFFVSLAVWAASLAVWLAAAKLLLPKVPSLAWLGSRIPEIPYAAPIAASEPLVVFLVASVIGNVALLFWSMRVHKVEVAPDALRIWRGLRPFPKRYDRPRYGNVTTHQNVVMVGRLDQMSIINASASPTLADAEVPWIAATLRRALRETAR